MKDLAPIFTAAREKANHDVFANKMMAVERARRLFKIDSRPEEWQKTPEGHRLCLQPGVQLDYFERLNQFHLRRTRKRKAPQYEVVWDVISLAEQLSNWGYS